MKYLIVPTIWLLERGINAETFRKSLDGTKAIVHKNFLIPVINGEVFPEYEFDSMELRNIIESDEWSIKDNMI